MSDTILINGADVRNYGVEIVREYSIGGTQIENTIFLGRNRSSYPLLASVYGRKSYSFTLVYVGTTQREVYLAKSTVESMMWGKPEIYMPNDFYYTSTLEDIQDGVFEGVEEASVILPVKYSLSGIQHDALVTTGGQFTNAGTLPYADCKVSCTVSTAADNYTLAGVTFADVTAGENLVVDGIAKRILRNGAPAPGNVTFINFPTVTPGANTFSALDPVTVEYYPCYL